MRFHDVEGCMYMLAYTNNKNFARAHLDSAFINTSPSAPLVPGQHHETSQTKATRCHVGEQSVVIPESSIGESAYDSDGHDSGIIIDHKKSFDDNPPISDKPPFEVMSVFGKGLGVVATKHIKREERILVEKQLISHPREFSVPKVIERYSQLAEADKIQISGLSNIWPKKPHPVVGVIYTNSIRISQTGSGLFITASRLNHACTPNTNHTWNPALQAITIHATVDIAEGEELTSSYFKGAASLMARKRVLEKDFGFTCDCVQCLLAGEKREQSDERMERIAVLERKLASALPAKRPVTVVGCTENSLYVDIMELLAHYEMEGITDCRPAEAYVYASRLSAHDGHVYRLIEFAEHALRIYSSLKGDDHPETIERRAQLERLREMGLHQYFW